MLLDVVLLQSCFGVLTVVFFSFFLQHRRALLLLALRAVLRLKGRRARG
jgi:hypothetical protein